MMGLACFEASNGTPGGGVCPNAALEARVSTRNVAARNIRNIIIDGVQGIVRSIFIKREKGGKSVSLESVRAVLGGLEGDHHTGFSKRRQILLVSGNVLDGMNLQPGMISENVVIDDVDVMALKEGQQLRLGDALVAVTLECDPCIQMDRIRDGLREILEGHRGMFVKVIAPGTVRRGDRLEVLWQQSAVENSPK